jgi:hypothetical protein
MIGSLTRHIKAGIQFHTPHQQTGSMIGSITRHIKYWVHDRLSHLRHIKDWVHDRLSHTHIKDWVHYVRLSHTHQQTGSITCGSLTYATSRNGSITCGSLSHATSGRLGPLRAALSHTSGPPGSMRAALSLTHQGGGSLSQTSRRGSITCGSLSHTSRHTFGFIAYSQIRMVPAGGRPSIARLRGVYSARRALWAVYGASTARLSYGPSMGRLWSYMGFI